MKPGETGARRRRIESARLFPGRFVLAVSLGLVLLGLGFGLGVGGCDRDGSPEHEGAVDANGTPEVVPPPPARPLPAREAAALQALREQVRDGAHAAAARAYADLLVRLEKAWGAESRDLAPHHHDAIILLRRAGLLDEAIALLARGRQRWPEQLQLKSLEATVRAERADRSKRFDPVAAEIFGALLEPDVVPRLRGYRIDPGRLHAQWSRLLLLGGRFAEALRAADSGLVLAPRSGELLEARALVLGGLQRTGEARPLLEDLVVKGRRDHLRPLLARARLESGDAEGAWELYRELLEARSEGTGSPSGARSEPDASRRLRQGAANALIELGRGSRASEVLLEVLAAEPDDPESLLASVRALRLEGRSEEARALHRRAQTLAVAASNDDAAKKAQLEGHPAAVLLHRARALAARERPGEALALLEQAVRTLPDLLEAHLELARNAARLGRRDTAVRALEECHAATGASLALVELARLRAESGDGAQARALLEKADENEKSDTKITERDATVDGFPLTAVLHARRVHVLLAIGDLESARTSVDGGELAESARLAGETAELALGRAELALQDGNLELAGSVLAGSFENIPGVGSWPDAQRLALGLQSGEFAGRSSAGNPAQDSPDAAPAEEDWSALVEHPHVLAVAGDSEVVERLRALDGEVDVVLSGMTGRRDADVVDLWRRALVRYRDAGCHRKAREIAFHLVALRPLDAALQRELVALFNRPEDLARRYAALLRLARLESDPAEKSETTARLEELRLRLGASR